MNTNNLNESSNGIVSQRYYVLITSKKPENENDIIFTDIKKINEKIKETKNARFKTFFDRQQAVDFLMSVQYTEEDVEELTENFERSLYFDPGGRELNVLKRMIETGDCSGFYRKIHENPRFIVDGNDLPPIIHKGFRYNIAHLASMKNHVDILKALFDSIESTIPMKRLYPSASDEAIAKRVGYIIDRYLNTPEKGNCETPLHLASKFGHEEIISFLVGHPKTDKTLRNKQKKIAKDIVCSRCNASQEYIAGITELFDAEFYVALVDEEEMYSPKLVSPLRLNSNNGLSPKTKIRGLAGPTSSKTAISLTKLWRQTVRTPSQKPVRDINQSFHQTGRDLTTRMSVNWMEYWAFLNCYEDLRSPRGLWLVEEFLIKRLLMCLVPHFIPSGIDLVDSEDFHSICSDESFTSCCTEFDGMSPYGNYPLLIPWGNDHVCRIRFCCCTVIDTTKETINVYFPLSLPNVENTTECSVEFCSHNFVFTGNGIITEIKDLLVWWSKCLQNEPSLVYRCHGDFTTAFSLKSVTEFVFTHKKDEIRVTFPKGGNSHRLSLIVECECVDCEDVRFYIGGSKVSSEDWDVYDLLEDVLFDSGQYPLISRWRSLIKRFDM